MYILTELLYEFGSIGNKNPRFNKLVSNLPSRFPALKKYPELTPSLKALLSNSGRIQKTMDVEKGQGEVSEGKDHPSYELSKHPTKPAPKMPDQSKVKPAPEFKEDDETKARTQKYYDEHPNALD